MSKARQLHSGLSLVEVLVGVAVLALVLGAAAAAVSGALKLSRQNVHVAQANYLLAAAAEQIRFQRDTSWQANIANYTSSSTSSGIFQISSAAYPVSRDSSGRVVASGGIVDVGTKKFVVTAAWSERGATTTRQLVFYLTNLFSN